MVNLISQFSSKRTTMSLARYLMSVHLKRKLLKSEQVDHIDNNKLNDTIENLQILSQIENTKKENKRYRDTIPKYITLTCPTCSKSFEYLSRMYNFYSKRGRVSFHCSRACCK